MNARDSSGPAAEGRFSRAFPDDDASAFAHVQTWLNRIQRGKDAATDEADQFAQDVHQDPSSWWHPHQLPVAPIPLDTRSPNRQRKSRRGQNRPISTSSDKFETYHYATTPKGDSLATGSDKESRKRPKYPDPHYSVSDDLRFERRPRRKTRHSRYDSKKRDGNKTFSDMDKTEAKHRGRTMNHIRSSRDIMNNFVSDAISTKRLTLRPELKPGLFLNGRSSRPAGITDLSFNEMHFLSDQDESRREGLGDRNTTSDGFDNRERGASFVAASAGGASTIFHAESDHHAQDKRHGGFEGRGFQGRDLVVNNRSQLRHESRDRSREHSMLDRVLPRQDCSGSENRASPPYSLGTSGSMLEALIETGVFNGTGILARSHGIGNEKQPIPSPEDTAERSEAYTHTLLSYKDKGTLVSLDSPRRFLPKDLHPGMDPNHQEDAKNGRSAPSEVSAAGQLDIVLPSHTDDSGHVNFNPGPSEYPSLPESEGLDPPGCPGTTRSEQAETEYVCDLHGQFRPVTEIPEGDHHYIRSRQSIHDTGLCLDSIWPPFQPLLDARPPLPPWQPDLDHQHRHDWQFDPSASTSIPKDLLRDLHNPFLEVESLSPRPPSFVPELSKDPSTYERVEADKENLDPSNCFGGAVNVNDYIERIEAELLATWNEAELLPDGNVVDDEQSLSNLEHTAPQDHFSEIEPRGQRRESTPGQKDSFVSGQHPHIGTTRYSAMPTVDRGSLASEEEMLAFWRPNGFL